MKTLDELLSMVDKCMFEAAYPSATTSTSTRGVVNPIAKAKAELESELRELIADAELKDKLLLWCRAAMAESQRFHSLSDTDWSNMIQAIDNARKG